MAIEGSNLRIVTERLEKGTELKSRLREIAKEHNISCGYVISLVGSLTKVKLKLPSAYTTKHKVYDTHTGKAVKDVLVYDLFEEEGIFEINAGGGSISKDNIHIHLNLNDPDGKCIGGHLLTGSFVFSTVELCILCIDDVKMYKKFDPNTGHRDVVLEPQDE